MSFIHAGVIVALAQGNYFVDDWGNVFVGRSWVGRLRDGEDLYSFLRGIVREYFRRNGPFVIRTVDFDVFVDEHGRIFYGSDVVFGPDWGDV